MKMSGKPAEGLCISYTTLRAAINEAELCHPGEVVHVWRDGSVSHGTDYHATVPGPLSCVREGVVYTFDPARSDDPWDCFEVVD